jgi:hypothetical protein
LKVISGPEQEPVEVAGKQYGQGSFQIPTRRRKSSLDVTVED